jgi:hypothetical protein
MKNHLTKLRPALTVMALLLGSATPAMAQLSIGIGVAIPGARIGINLSDYPDFVRVPDYPVYYAPHLQDNFFFYDGMYWVYERDEWYSSTWYDGPWWLVEPEAVPYFILRVPVRYYRSPPRYFSGWGQDAPPRWGDHWGRQWQQRRSGWDQWDRRAAPAPAPLPTYQRQYSGNRYPQVDQQRALTNQNYRYQPRDAAVKQRFERQAAPVAAPAPQHERSQPQQQERRQQEQARPQPQQERRQQDQPRAEQRGQRQQPAPAQQQQPRPEQPPNQGKGRDKGDGGDRSDKADKGDNGDQRGRDRKN